VDYQRGFNHINIDSLVGLLERMMHQIRVDDLPREIGEHRKNHWRDNGMQEVASLEFVALVKALLPEQFLYDTL
jgi:hypothetical protein